MQESAFGWLLLCAAAFVAGAVNSIAGGGTLLTFPSLLALISPVAANATSTTALLPGTFASAWGYRRELADSREHLRRLWIPSLLGGIAGSLLVIRLPETVFAKLIPWLLTAACVLFLLQPAMSRWIGANPHGKPSGRTVAGIVVFQFLVALYGGYFGAGIGILMLSSLAFMGIPDIHRMNAVKAVLATVINGVTVIIFITAGVVVWKYAAVMAAASIAGGYGGARVARRMPVALVRAIVVCIGFGVAILSWLRH